VGQAAQVFRFLALGIAAVFRPGVLLVAENPCVRQQLLVLQRGHPRPRLSNADRRFWLDRSYQTEEIGEMLAQIATAEAVRKQAKEYQRVPQRVGTRIGKSKTGGTLAPIDNGPLMARTVSSAKM
jgi:hypothetical protein